ncbi:CynX/NimT family MFS transporter [Priestia sp. YIM B13446]|uniref:MFS transporter n=1 Tax=Priestia TaxID=2800373 RepID=UPI0004AFE2B9|nr:MFS transporter [Priestia megaterium]RCX28682.1 CP family cyanate transporter-like MFS transporter [Bacillus sp. AG236]MCP1450914.1 CP family cyanate transporter-like MFS transporter [Priestia megaterium]MED4052387.1 MFS transporter [Priestia megaterium]PFD99759.1 MFS transporter [Priestia megaterium]PFJ98623.1 MFS transporter [Priestia megaterium]
MVNRNKLFLFALILAAFNLRPGLTSVSPVLHGITKDLGMSSTLASLLTSIPLLCFGFCSLFAGRLANRYQPEKMITFAITCIGIATFLRAFTNSSIYLLITALLIGAGIGVVSPLLSGFIKSHFPDKAASMIGIYSTSMVVGASISIGLTTPLQHWFNNSWKNGLAFWSILALLAIPLWLMVIKQSRIPVSNFSQKTKASLPLKNKKAWLLTSFVGIVTLLFYCFAAWLPAIVEEKGWTPAFGGLVGTIAMISQLPATLLLPSLLKVLPSRRFWITTFTLSIIIGLSLLCFTNVTPIVSSICLGVGAGGLVSLTLLLPLDMASSPLEASTWSAMTQAIGYMIGAVGPFIIGFLHDYLGSFVPTLYLLIIIGFIAILLGWKITKPAKGKTEGLPVK